MPDRDLLFNMAEGGRKKGELRAERKLHVVYSETSDSGSSEKGTQYKRPLYQGHCSKSLKIAFPIVSIH